MLLLLLLASVSLAAVHARSTSGGVHAHPPPSIDSDVWQHVHKLTVAQKIGQMTQVNIDAILSGDLTTRADLTTINTTRLVELLEKYHIGSWLNSPMSNRTVPGWPGPNAAQWRRMVDTIHKHSIRVDGIPTLYGIDSVHGGNYIAGATLFPHQINAAATFNLPLIQRMGEVTAKDTRAASIPWTFAPILDIAVHPAWPRVFETFGEDPHLVSEMAGAMIRGLQGVRASDGRPDLSHPRHVAACFKHFIGYSNPRDGHDRVESWIPDRQLLEYFLPPFQAAIQQHQVATGMLAYVDLNGVPVSTSSSLTINLLRDDLGFNGTLVSDFNEIFNLHTWHRLAPTVKESVSLALRTSSLDMAMGPEKLDLWFTSMQQLVADEILPEARLNIAVARVLQLKKDLGLAQAYPVEEYTPETPSEELLESIGSQADRDLSLEVAHESIVLLQNDGTLPILLDQQSSNPTATSKGERLKNGAKIRRILVVGPTGDSIARQNGGWTHHWQGSQDDDEFAVGSTVYSAVKRLVEASASSSRASEVTVAYEPGVLINGSSPGGMLERALSAAEDADLVLACIGEEVYAEKPGDIEALSLPWTMQNLVNQLTSLPKRKGEPEEVEESKEADGELHNKRVILILLQGRPRILDSVDLTRVRGVLHAGLPGPEGGQAIADIVFGLVNPSARLPITYPSGTGALPIQYYHKHSQATTYRPNWEFGAGLSYTNFSYSDLTLSASHVDSQATLDVTVRVKNIGAVAGKETVLLYLSDLYRIVSPEVKRLRGFQKITLQPGASQSVTFTLGYADFSFIGVGLDRRTEGGRFSVQVGDQSASFLLDQSLDDLYDTEVVVTRKMVKRWWKTLKNEMREEDQEAEREEEAAQDIMSTPDDASSSSSSSHPRKTAPRHSAAFHLAVGLLLLGVMVGGSALAFSFWRRQSASSSSAGGGSSDGDRSSLMGRGRGARSGRPAGILEDIEFDVPRPPASREAEQKSVFY